MARTVDAEEAARSLHELLTEVEQSGETFLIERQGRVVAQIGPAGETSRRVQWKDVLAALESGPRPDPDFARDIEGIRRSVPALPGILWERWGRSGADPDRTGGRGDP